MQRWRIRGWLGLLLALVTALAAPAALGRDSGFARIQHLQLTAKVTPSLATLQASRADPAGRDDRLSGAAGGAGWWRLQPRAVPPSPTLFLVFHPYSARVTVLAPPDYRPRTQDMFDPDLDPRYSRRALAFPVAGPGPIYVRVTDARYPLQVVLRDPALHAVRDRMHGQVLYASGGVLIGVCLVALVFWLVLRERVYLLYAGCMAMQLLYMLCAYGEAYSLPGLRLLGYFRAPGVWWVATLSTIVSVYFLLDFAELRVRTPRLARVFRWIGAYLPAMTLLLLLSPWPANDNWFPNVGNALLLLANILAIVSLFAAWRRGSRHAGMVLLAWIPLVLVSTCRAVQLSSGAALPPWLEYALPLVLAWTAVVLMLGMADRMRAFRRERDHAQYQAERDPLTGVLNRAGIERRLEWALETMANEYRPLAVLFLDIDHFKKINDSHGHAVGDACLGALVRILAAELQYGDQVGRIGGEEFLLVLPGADRRRARDIAEHIRRSVEARCRQIAGVPVAMTVSIGVAASQRGDTGAALISRADEAMYAAKSAGRNRVCHAGAAD
jgi:diguanylate cyclase (GGDEF)-like protein